MPESLKKKKKGERKAELYIVTEERLEKEAKMRNVSVGKVSSPLFLCFYCCNFFPVDFI